MYYKWGRPLKHKIPAVIFLLFLFLWDNLFSETSVTTHNTHTHHFQTCFSLIMAPSESADVDVRHPVARQGNFLKLPWGGGLEGVRAVGLGCDV